MYTPVNPSFTIQKWVLRGSTLYRHVFVVQEGNEQEKTIKMNPVISNFRATDKTKK